MSATDEARPVLRGLRGDVDVELVHAALTCPGLAPGGFGFIESRVSDPDPPAMSLTMPNGLCVDDPLAAVRALTGLDGFETPPLTGRLALNGCVTRILTHFICGWLRRMALHFRWFRAPDDGRIREMARCWLDLPASASRDPDARRLIVRAEANLRARGQGQAEAVGAGRQSAPEMTGEWTRLAPLLQTHIEAEADDCGACFQPSTLPGALLAGATRGGLPLPPPVLARLEDSVIAAAVSPSGDSLPESLSPILQYIAMSYHPVLRVNRALLAEGARHMTVDLGYGSFGMPCQPAWEEARRELARDLASLAEDERAAVRRRLGSLGVLEVYELA